MYGTNRNFKIYSLTTGKRKSIIFLIAFLSKILKSSV